MMDKNSAKFFGEYLVAAGIVSEDALLSALFEQMRSIPSVCEIVFKKKVLSSQQVLQAIKTQNQKQIEFKAACQELGFWSSEVEASVLAEVKNARIPLGQVLVKAGAADLSTITKALDEFLARVEEPKASPSAPKLETSKTAEVSEPTAGPKIDSVLLEELFTNLNADRIEKFKNIINGFDYAEDNIKIDVVKALVAEVHFMRGLFRTLRLEKIEKLLSAFEEYGLKILEKLKTEKGVELAALGGLGMKAMLLVEELLDSLKKDPSAHAWPSGEGAQKFDNLVGEIAGQRSES